MKLLCTNRRYIPGDTLRNNDVITSKRRHFQVIRSKWRRFDVITSTLYIKFPHQSWNYKYYVHKTYKLYYTGHIINKVIDFHGHSIKIRRQITLYWVISTV